MCSKLALPAECTQQLCEAAQDMIVHKVYQHNHTDFIKASHASSMHAACQQEHLHCSQDFSAQGTQKLATLAECIQKLAMHSKACHACRMHSRAM